MSEVLKWMALGEMAQRSRIGGGSYVKLADFDAEHALRLEAERRIVELEGDGSWGDMALTVKLDTAMGLLRSMTFGYREAISNGYDRIIFLGGDCDSPEKMLADNPSYSKAMALLNTNSKTTK